MDLGLAGRVAIITGGSKGIGLAVAHALAGEGVNIAMCARGKAELDAAAGQIRARGVQALPVVADMTKPADIESFAQQVRQTFGRVDILVNNAVASSQAGFSALSEEEWRHHIDVKLMGYVRMARAVLPAMSEARWGRIINVAGMTARIVTEYRMTNGVVNAAVTNFAKHLAEQVGKDGITVNAIHPGYTWTPRLEGGLKRWAELDGLSLDEVIALRKREIPIGRFIDPADIANLVVFLCSPLAGAITGQAIAVDGGSGRAISY